MKISPRPHQNSNITTRSEPNNPYPTTFVQADASSFKQVVQMLTGSPETAKQLSGPDPHSKTTHNHSIPPIKSLPKRQHSNFKLYERRNALHHHNLHINPAAVGFSPRNCPEILSPSMLDFPSLLLSPVTPLIRDPFAPSQPSNEEAEAKAIREKGFYFHPSPATTPRESEPELLPLFPVTSPRQPGPSSPDLNSIAI